MHCFINLACVTNTLTAGVVKPVIYRATEQWFSSVDGYRQQALDAIDNQVQWIPKWGHDRIFNMVRDRGDWVISRQRIWGVPIPIYYCESCGEHIINDDTIKALQEKSSCRRL